jgi:hypothetical protein
VQEQIRVRYLIDLTSTPLRHRLNQFRAWRGALRKAMTG